MTYKRWFNIATLLFLSIFPPVYSQAANANAPAVRQLPDDWYPESVAAGSDGGIYVGSWHQGAVAYLPADGGPAQILVLPGSNGLANAQGLLVDEARHILWVCSGNIGFTTVPSTPSALKSFDLATGKPLGSYPMPEQGYCNDLAMDERGNIYVTDSLHPRILRLGVGEQILHVWKEDAAFAAGNDAYCLNGIALDGKHMYVSLVSAMPYLLRVDIDADQMPGSVQRVIMPRVLKNADAIRIYAPQHIAIFESNAFGKTGPYGGQISIADLSQQSVSLQTVVTGLNDPSSGIVMGTRLYFIESKYGLLFQHKDELEKVPRKVPFTLESRELPQ